MMLPRDYSAASFGGYVFHGWKSLLRDEQIGPTSGWDSATVGCMTYTWCMCRHCMNVFEPYKRLVAQTVQCILAAMTHLATEGEQLPKPAAPLRVLLADDHPIVRSGIRNELIRHSDIQVVGEAADGDEALRLAEALKPDVLILDIAMPGLKAVQIIRQLRARSAPPYILVLTAYRDTENVLGMLQAGATGYLLKDEDPAAIVEGVRTVARGRTWLSPTVAEAMQRGLGDEKKPEALTEQEIEILRQLAEGKTDREVSQKLGIAERTVRYRLRVIYDKLGVNTRVEAVVWAVKQGLRKN